MPSAASAADSDLNIPIPKRIPEAADGMLQLARGLIGHASEELAKFAVLYRKDHAGIGLLPKGNGRGSMAVRFFADSFNGARCLAKVCIRARPSRAVHGSRVLGFSPCARSSQGLKPNFFKSRNGTAKADALIQVKTDAIPARFSGACQTCKIGRSSQVPLQLARSWWGMLQLARK